MDPVRPWTLRSFVAITAAAVGIACADGPSAPRVDVSAANAVSCPTSVNDLIAQARVLFGPYATDFNSVRGKLQNLDQHLRNGRTAQAQARAHDIVDFTLAQRDAGRLSGSPEQIAAFINGVYCFAGIDIVIDTPEDTWFILPSDQPQILYGLDSTVGISLPGLPVSEPSLLRVEQFDGQLNTKLDQYPGFVRITLLNDGGTMLTGRATITVCALGAPSPEVAERLRLGHGINETGFEITPEPTSADPVPANVVCEEAPTTLLGRVMNTVREVFTPRTLEASAAVSVRRFGGGVSGTVTEFSPFAPVDPYLSFGGGVSGTVTEFSRDAMMMMSTESVDGSCESVPVGTDLPAACQPTVTIRTFNGTIFQNVPVDWTVTSDALGRIAPRSGNLDAITCGAYGTTAATTTSLNGNAGVCWQLGGVGMNTVVARARAGGDAPEGVTFVNGDSDAVTFNINVTDVSLAVVQGEGVRANAPFTTTAQVRAVDASGSPVAGVEVNWVATGGSVTPATSVTGADGLATVSWTLGLGTNTLLASVRNAASGVTITGTGKDGDVLPPGAAANVDIVSGDGQSGPAGAPLAPLVVRVTDINGAPVAGAAVTWDLRTGHGSLSALSTTTDANGLTSITFTPGLGTSEVKAYIQRARYDDVSFFLTGVAP